MTTDDAIRAALAEAWLEHWALTSDIERSDRELAGEYADALLPTVRRLMQQQAAEELEGWARSFRRCGEAALARRNRRVMPEVADVLEAGARDLLAEDPQP